MALNSFAVFDALKDLSITEYTCYGDITDDDSLKQNLKIKVGINTTTDEVIFAEPTFTYSEFKSKYDLHLAKEPMNKLREARDDKLLKTDWTQNADVPNTISEKYKKYRQELRDLPAQSGLNPKIDDAEGLLIDDSVTWPTEPS